MAALAQFTGKAARRLSAIFGRPTITQQRVSSYAGELHPAYSSELRPSHPSQVWRYAVDLVVMTPVEALDELSRQVRQPWCFPGLEHLPALDRDAPRRSPGQFVSFWLDHDRLMAPLKLAWPEILSKSGPRSFVLDQDG
jgi:hypothetical protein